MQVKILAFAQAADAAGFREISTDAAGDETPRALIAKVAPKLALDSMRVAVDCEYWDWDKPIGNSQEIAIIPPVSGG